MSDLSGGPQPRPTSDQVGELLEDVGNPAKRSGRSFEFHYLAPTLAVVSSNIRRIITFFEAESMRMTKHVVRSRRKTNKRGEVLARTNELLTEPAAAP